ncbi:hypothetical protein DASC09_013320 [Saccharomycopsis crataegensis]|uniref:Uncharacterized protein n=1 Tax=Saccharomycopsis crataegensis TaxID=43959 RepID=A0AAV5QHC5_9ASCO|nr:hypothetical protein DASC09_013320 [Saccharomycopsis crataegensis]
MPFYTSSTSPSIFPSNNGIKWNHRISQFEFFDEIIQSGKSVYRRRSERMGLLGLNVLGGGLSIG